MELKIRLGAFGAIEHRLFDEEDRMLLGEAREELLRALPDESPAQMAEDDDAVAIGLATLGGFDAGVDRTRDGRLAGQAGSGIGQAIGGAERGDAVGFA